METPNLQPTLLGPNVIIRPVSEDDWEGMFAAASDPKIWEVHPAKDRYLESVFRGYFDGAVASRSAFALVDRQTQAIFGSSRYYGYDATISEIEIGWTFLARSHWGGAYNAEVKKLMLDHAFEFVDTVVFWVGEANFRSQGAMRKIGGVLRPGKFTREVSGETPHLIYEITKPRTGVPQP